MKETLKKKELSSKKIWHETVSFFLDFLQYPNMIPGMCQGFSMMLLQALLLKEEDHFFERLKLLEAYNPGFGSYFELLASGINLSKDIVAARNKLISKEELTANEKLLTELPMLFDGISLYQNPDSHIDLFQENVNQTDVTMLYDLLKPNKLETTKLHILLNKPYLYTKNKLKDFLMDLETVFKKGQSRYPVLMKNDQHILLATYNPEQGNWFYVDTNDFGRYLTDPSYFRTLDCSQLVDSLFVSLATPSAKILPLYATVVSTQHPEIDEIKAALDTVDLNYPITTEQILMEDENKLSLLHLVCQGGDLSLFHQILRYPGIDINKARLSDGLTPLGMVCMKGQREMLETLIEHPDIDMNKGTNKSSPLKLACIYRHGGLIKQLVADRRTHINGALDQGDTAFFYACSTGQLDIVNELLLCPDLNPNLLKEGQLSPLAAACNGEHLKIIDALLVDPRVDINQTNDAGESILWQTCGWGKLASLRALLKRKDLVMNNASKGGYTPIYKACDAGHVEIVDELIKYAVDVNQCGKEGFSPLAIAVYRGNLEVVEALLKHPDLQINQKIDKGLTAFHIACRSGEVEIAKRLYATGKVNLNQVDSAGNTPLHMICDKLKKPQDAPLFEWLLENQSNPFCKNARGRTAFDEVVISKNESAILILSKFIAHKRLNPITLMSLESWEKVITGKSEIKEMLMPLKDDTFLINDHFIKGKLPNFFREEKDISAKNEVENFSKISPES